MVTLFVCSWDNPGQIYLSLKLENLTRVFYLLKLFKCYSHAIFFLFYAHTCPSKQYVSQQAKKTECSC